MTNQTRALAKRLGLMSERLVQTKPQVTGDTSDGYHTFNELYAYRKAFNALLFNEWAARGLYDVHKSLRHSDSQLCFGGGWFIVQAETPEGQISNHYHETDWDLFRVPVRFRANAYDGHTPQIALERMLRLAMSSSPAEPKRNESARGRAMTEPTLRAKLKRDTPCKRCGHPADWHRHDDEACLSKHPQPCAPAGCGPGPINPSPFRCLGYDCEREGPRRGTPESRCGCPDFLLSEDTT